MDHHYVAFAGVAAGMIMLPGVDFTIVMRNALDDRLRGIATGLGVSLGLLLHTAIAAAGLAVIVSASDGALTTIQYAGAAYLLYLGGSALYAAWRGLSVHAPDPSARSTHHGESGRQRSGLPAVVLQGFATNALNPKAPILFLSLMPQFLPPGRSTTWPLIAMSAIVVLLGLTWFPTVAFVASHFSKFITSQSRQVAVNGITGTLLVIFAVTLAMY